jgi:ubiquitin thioesterase protein OTUB1
LQAELARLTSLNDYIENVGVYQRDIFEDFVDGTFELINDLIGAMSSGQDAMAILRDRFNDPGLSPPIIYHLRLLATSWLKGHLDLYADFLSQDVNSYCDEWILPVNREIEHLGVVLLYNILLKPANIVLEIAYLDRSEGDKVNVHRNPDEANGQDPATLGPMICLLYRPGHYDILYRPPTIRSGPSGAVSLQVNRVTSFSHQADIQSSVPSLGSFATLDMSALAMIPGMDAPVLGPLTASSVASPLADGYTPSPEPSWVATPPMADGLPPSEPSPPQQQQQQQTTVTPPNPDPVRFSKYNFPLRSLVDASVYSPEPTFTTSTFKNSHFNVAHYNNPHFQPEEYKPGCDDEVPTGRSGGRRRS